MTNVQVTVRGEVPEEAAGYALEKIRHAVSRTPAVDQIHVVLTVVGNPANEEPAVIEAEAEVAGAPVHVHAAAASLTAAVDDAADRLRRRLTDLRERPRSRRHARVAVVTASEEEQEDD
jgi:ribosome-associated translation inhibitor RaiA